MLTCFLVCTHFFGKRADRPLEGGEDDGQDEDAEEEGALVGDGVDDGVFVELAAGGEEPELGDPEEEDGEEEPEASGVAVEVGVELRDVEQ